MRKKLVVILGLLLATFGGLLSACGNPYSQTTISASYEGQENGYLLLSVGSEAIITFSFSNLPQGDSPDLFLTTSSNNIKTEIISLNYAIAKCEVKVTSLMRGDCVLRAKSKMSGNEIDILIKSSLSITNFNLKADATYNLFAVRGENNPKNLTLNSSFFNFEPKDTNQTQLIFKDSEDNVLTEIDGNDYTDDIVRIYASSPYLTKVVEMEIKIISEISIVDVYEAARTSSDPIPPGIGENDKLLTSKEQGETPSNISFITNRSIYARKIITVAIEGNTSEKLRVARAIYSQSVLLCSDFDTSTIRTDGISTYFDFELQSLQDGETTIEFSVYLSELESYQIKRTFDVKVENAPDEIRINDIKNEENVAQTLFDNYYYSTVTVTNRITVVPQTALFDSFVVSVIMPQDLPLTAYDYIEFKMGNDALFRETNSHDLNNLSIPIVAKGKKTTEGKMIRLQFTCYWGLNLGLDSQDSITYELDFVVKTGAPNLMLENKYIPQPGRPSGIYLKVDDEPTVFNGIYVASVDAYTDNFIVIPITPGASLFAHVEPVYEQIIGDIDQSGDGDLEKYISIRITPTGIAGTGTWKIILPNGVGRDLKITTIPNLENVYISVDEANSSPITFKEYDENDNLTIEVKLSKVEQEFVAGVKLKLISSPISFDGINESLYSIENEILNEGIFSVDGNLFLTIENLLTPDIQNEEALTFKFTYKKIVDFLLYELSDFEDDPEDENDEYDQFIATNQFSGMLTINAFLSITNVSFSKREISLYSYSSLGFYYKDLSQATVDILFNPTDLNFNTPGLTYTLSSSIDPTKTTGNLIVPDYGTYFWESKMFRCDMSGSLPTSFYIYIVINYHNDVFTASLKVTTLNYEKVTNVRLYNYIQEVYLDPSHPYQDLWTYVNPIEAVHKDVMFSFEPNIGSAPNLIRIEPITNGVRVHYNNVIEGGNGYLVISPKANIMDVSQTPDGALRIPIRVGSGSITNPFRISTVNELLDIKYNGLDKHYLLTNTIDMTGINFTSLGEFSGSINGLGTGRITGLKILNGSGNLGLFTRITGQIKNLVIEGNINLTLSSGANVGLLCGEIALGATIENVSVILGQSKIEFTSASMLNIGGLAGINNGTIITNIDHTYAFGKTPLTTDSSDADFPNYVDDEDYDQDDNTTETLFVRIRDGYVYYRIIDSSDFDGDGDRTEFLFVHVLIDKLFNYTNYSPVIMNSQFTILSKTASLIEQSTLGGIVGLNNGNISKVSYSNKKLFNNDNYSSIVNFNVVGSLNVTNSSNALKFEIGSLAGKNTMQISAQVNNLIDPMLAMDNLNYSNYIKTKGKIEIIQSHNKLGGLVGLNVGTSVQTALVSYALTRVYLISKNEDLSTAAHLGGIFALNQTYGLISNCVIQSLEDGNTTGVGATMIYSTHFGINESGPIVQSERVNVFGLYGIVPLNQNDDALAISSNLKCETYIGTIRELIDTTQPIYETINNYYGDLFIGTISRNIQRQFALKTASLFNDPEQTINRLNALIPDPENPGEFIDDPDAVLMSYLFYYEATDSSNQGYLKEKNIYDLPFIFEGEILIISLNTNIITVQNNGQLFIRGTGIAQLAVLSSLNARLRKDVFIYVVNAADGFTLYASSAAITENIISNGKQVNVYENEILTLSVVFSHIDVLVGSGYYISLFNGSEFSLVDKNEVVGERTVEFIQIGNSYALKAVNSDGLTSFSIYSMLNFDYNGKIYSSETLFNDESGSLNYDFFAYHYKGAISIIPNYDELTIEPIEEINFNVVMQTDDFADSVNIETTKLLPNGDFEIPIEDEYFKVFETNRIYKLKLSDDYPSELSSFILQINKLEYNSIIELWQISETKSLIIAVNVLNHTFSIDGVGTYSMFEFDMDNYFYLDKNLTYQFQFKTLTMGIPTEFNLETVFKLQSIQIFYNAQFDYEFYTNNYQAHYYINLSSNSTPAINNAIDINLITQNIERIIVDSFEGISQINSGAPQSSFLDPGNPNHFRIEIYPYFADYDYIEITGQPAASGLTSILTWINLDGSNRLGAFLIPNGIRISKSLIVESASFEKYIYIKYDTSSMGVKNGDVFVFNVTAFKNSMPIYSTVEYVTVKFKQDVQFSIVGKTATPDNLVYLTRGSTYNFIISSIGYNNNEIIMTSSESSIVSVNFANKTINVTSNTITYPSSEGISGVFEIYGRKQVGDEIIQSVTFRLYYVVLDYYITTATQIVETNEIINGTTITKDGETKWFENTIIKNGTLGTVNIGLGNSYKLETEFLNGLTIEYERNISGIVEVIKMLESSINRNASWQYQMGIMDSEGNFSYNSSSWINIVSSVSPSATSGYFAISKTSAGDFVFTPLKLNNPLNPAYKFRLSYGYEYSFGRANYVAFGTENATNVIATFDFNIYQLSSSDTPTPIYNSQQFSSMQEGAYYILLNDIVLPTNFTPITAHIAGLDGNGKKIIIISNFSYENLGPNIGIFTSTATNSLIKNLTVEIQTTSRISINNSSSVYAGVLAGENNGSITNCFVKTLSSVSLRFVFINSVGTSNFVGGLVGNNNGYITNCRVEVSLSTSANLAGLVGYNSGKIASSFVANSLLINTSSEVANKTAGFVYYNSQATADGGVIMTSYVSGVHIAVSGEIPIYANSQSFIISSSTEVAGFIYENNGEISNCYSNIPIYTSSKSAGFVYLNKGLIKNAYSTSQLKSNSPPTSFGFYYDNSQGNIADSFYLSDFFSENNKINYAIDTSNDDLKINTATFAQQSTFTNFAFANVNELTKGIWFYPDSAYLWQFNNDNKIFILGRPELIPSNIIATSVLEIDQENSMQDPETGVMTYVYKNIGDNPQGSFYNPFIITSASLFEQRILETSYNNINTNNFRLVTNLDYEAENITSSNLYRIIMLGDIEGNGMEIRGYVINTSSSLASAGLFSKIGNGSYNQGSIKNITLKPRYINLPNTICVGGLAGTLDSGCVFNVKISGFAYGGVGIVILGRNIVGGLLGRAIGNYKLYNIQSSISTNSTYRSPKTLGQMSIDATDLIGDYFFFKNHTVSTMSKLSYSGTVVGVLAGIGDVRLITISGTSAVMGEFAGLFFGGIGNGVIIDDVNVNLVQGQFIQGAVYGGVIAGENYGTISNATVTSSYEITGLFKTVPFVAKAIGGLVGLMGTKNNIRPSMQETPTGGVITNCLVKTTITSNQVLIIGGLIGELIGANEDSITIEKSGFVGSINGLETVGGIVGRITNIPTAELKSAGYPFSDIVFSDDDPSEEFEILKECYVKDGTLSVVNDIIGSAKIGGLIGSIDADDSVIIAPNSKFIISDSYSRNVVKVKSDIYGAEFNICVGGLIGEFGFGNLDINSTYSTSRLIIELRDLKANGAEGGAYDVFFGELVGYSYLGALIDADDFVYYQSRQVRYVGVVGEDLNHYLLLKVLKDGLIDFYIPTVDAVEVTSPSPPLEEYDYVYDYNQLGIAPIPSFGETGFDALLWITGSNPLSLRCERN